MDEINEKMGTLDGIQIRAEAKVLEYFYNNTQVNTFCDETNKRKIYQWMKQDDHLYHLTISLNNKSLMVMKSYFREDFVKQELLIKL